MKMVVAFIKKNKFDDVIFALHKIEGLTGASSSNVHGFGHDRSRADAGQKPEMSLDFQPHIRLEVACRTELLEPVISAIQKAAHTGLHGDGKLYVLALEESVRIRTGQRGESAV
jgi:nitrogen regulatory protein PII